MLIFFHIISCKALSKLEYPSKTIPGIQAAIQARVSKLSTQAASSKKGIYIEIVTLMISSTPNLFEHMESKPLKLAELLKL